MEYLFTYLILIMVILFALTGYFHMADMKRARKACFYLLGTYFVLVILFAFIESRESKLYFDDLISIEYDDVVSLEIREHKLYHQDSDKEVLFNSYYNGVGSSVLKGYYPVYLKEVEDFYILAISRDKDKVYEYDRFLYMDYEFSDEDKLYIIEKSTGYVYDTEEYGLIGYEIDLNSFVFTEDKTNGNKHFLSAVFIPNDDGISYYRFYKIKSGYNTDESVNMYSNYSSRIMYDWEHDYVYTNQSPISGEMIYVDMVNVYFGLKDSNGNYSYGYYTDHEFGDDFQNMEYLENFDHVRDGYIRIKEDGIYYLNDDEEYRVITYDEGDKLIARNVSDEEFNVRVDQK